MYSSSLRELKVETKRFSVHTQFIQARCGRRQITDAHGGGGGGGGDPRRPIDARSGISQAAKFPGCVLRTPAACAFAIANSVSAKPRRKIPMTREIWSWFLAQLRRRRSGGGGGSDRRCSRWISNKTSARARKLHASYAAEGRDRTPPRKRSFHFRYISIGPT